MADAAGDSCPRTPSCAEGQAVVARAYFSTREFGTSNPLSTEPRHQTHEGSMFIITVLRPCPRLWNQKSQGGGLRFTLPCRCFLGTPVPETPCFQGAHRLLLGLLTVPSDRKSAPSPKDRSFCWPDAAFTQQGGGGVEPRRHRRSYCSYSHHEFVSVKTGKTGSEQGGTSSVSEASD